MPSTAIRQTSHDAMTDTLFVTFVDGDTYAYFGVPAATFQAFRAARSKGGFFARRIRNRYPYQRVERPGDDADLSPVQPSGGPAWPPPAGAGRSAG